MRIGYSEWVKRLAIALGPVFASTYRSLLRKPVFVVGFNKSAKSLLMSGMEAEPGVTLFPGEGNDVLWFKGFYPRSDFVGSLPPMWAKPDEFIDAVVRSRTDGFRVSRAQLGLYQLLRAPRNVLVNESGMLAGLLPEIAPVFPDARIIHIVRDGRVVSWIAARKMFDRVRAEPAKYQGADCPMSLEGILEAQARYWCWTIDRLSKVEVMMPGRVMTVRYEDWCLRPQGVLEELMAFVGLPASTHQAPWPQAVENLNSREIAAIPVSAQALLDRVLTPHLRRLGYAVSDLL